MNIEYYIDFLEKLDKTKFKHASNFLAKHDKFEKLDNIQKKAIERLLPEYYAYLNENLNLIGSTDDIIKKRVDLLNTYYLFILENGYDNVFTSQSKFRPTIIEEFLYILFRDLVKELKEKNNDINNVLDVGATKAYSNLYFTAKNLKNFIKNLEIGINTKDQDFAIYRSLGLDIDQSRKKIDIPIVSIECKTYIDKTMLEGSIATAEKIKSGNPYSLFLILTETYDVDLKVDPAYSRINQIYVLRKSKRRSKDLNQPIYHDVIIDLFKFVSSHLVRDWSDIQNKMTNLGKII